MHCFGFELVVNVSVVIELYHYFFTITNERYFCDTIEWETLGLLSFWFDSIYQSNYLIFVCLFCSMNSMILLMVDDVTQYRYDSKRLLMIMKK